MQNLILLFLRYSHFLVFLFLELLCLFLIVRYNGSQRDIWINSSNIVSGNVNNTFDSWTDYFDLRENAFKLATEKAKLKQQLLNLQQVFPTNIDSLELANQQYLLIPAKITNKSINVLDNYFTLNRGRKHGVRPDMGVISDDGIIGIVKSAGEDYSRVLTILHRQSSIVAANKKTHAFGTLKWSGPDYRFAKLEAYLKHEMIEVGDTIITSEYSNHFPEGIMIGTVKEKSLSKSDYFYNITIALNNNLHTEKYVYIIDNTSRQKQLAVESEDE